MPRYRRRASLAASLVLVALIAVAAIPAEAGRAPSGRVRFTHRPHGTLLAPRQLRPGIKRIAFAAFRPRGGIVGARLYVDYRVRGSRGTGSCFAPHPPRPCGVHSSGTFSLNTYGLANGPHIIYLTLVDAAGRNLAIAGPYDISTYRAGNPGAFGVLRAHLAAGRTRGRTITTTWGKRVSLFARLVDPRGHAVPSAYVEASRVRGLSLTRLGAASTGPRGGVSFRVPRGPSRRYVLRAYEGFSLAAIARVRLRVRPVVTLSVRPRVLYGTRTVTLFGRVRPGSVPRPGLLLTVQALRNGVWRSFDVARARRGDGRYRFRYTFAQPGYADFSLRVRAPVQAGYPYAVGTSRPVRVLLR